MSTDTREVLILPPTATPDEIASTRYKIVYLEHCPPYSFYVVSRLTAATWLRWERERKREHRDPKGNNSTL